MVKNHPSKKEEESFIPMSGNQSQHINILKEKHKTGFLLTFKGS